MTRVLFEIVMRTHERGVIALGDHGMMMAADVDDVRRDDGETETWLGAVIIFCGNLTHVVLTQGDALSSLEDHLIPIMVFMAPRMHYLRSITTHLIAAAKEALGVHNERRGWASRRSLSPVHNRVTKMPGAARPWVQEGSRCRVLCCAVHRFYLTLIAWRN